LRRNLPSVRVCRDEPALTPPGIVHVQHEPGILDDRRLARFAAGARERRLSVVVTEHSVYDRPSVWEPLVRALVTTTIAGGRLLKRRHPGQRVEVIPLGCETWSLPRKSSRGATIGFFGFLGNHKGLGRLAAAARLIPGSEVLLLAHHTGPVPAVIDAWPPDVPLRWERDWQSIPDIAGRLAAEADVLAFPYDEVAHRSASSAAVLGLSTGVPVLTTDTTWFADLGQAVVRVDADVPAIAGGLRRLLEDDDLRERTTLAARAHCTANSWSRIAARHVDLWNSFESE
jgi:glycosyltransferase involved in cell wall biosynthesis